MVARQIAWLHVQFLKCHANSRCAFTHNRLIDFWFYFQKDEEGQGALMTPTTTLLYLVQLQDKDYTCEQLQWFTLLSLVSFCLWLLCGTRRGFEVNIYSQLDKLVLDLSWYLSLLHKFHQYIRGMTLMSNPSFNYKSTLLCIVFRVMYTIGEWSKLQAQQTTMTLSVNISNFLKCA